jgi:tRNA uridine 5-carboxymethylaminomethyl modification enzyme
MTHPLSFDVVVVGGGHAGAEATRIAARAGLRVAMITMSRVSIGRMSCNPAVGGLAKGNLVKEIDALGGLMGEATDLAGIQFKVLNASKGPAVQGPRAQCDREIYAATVRRILESEPRVDIIEGTVGSLLIDSSRVRGVVLGDGSTIGARAVVVTTGTFLRALMHSGELKTRGGRFGEPSAETLSDSLRAAGLTLGRLKTGTPPRVLRDTIDFGRMEPQPGDERPRPFSIITDSFPLPQRLCHLTYTSESAHELIRANLHRAPMYSGQIRATGPRYCPSIEDKVVRFADKPRHQVFVEPEGLDNPWVYLNGVSTSLPPDVQDGVVRSLPGMEQAVIARYGYAVEYDFVNPEQLDPSLKVRGIEGLYLAGQINGTSGYEEAAGQGLIAGINAALALRGDEPLVLRRDQAYIGVMVDDLVTLGTEEPYRMFTSRAEHRLLLGCDSVYQRLSPIAARLGLLDDVRIRRTEERMSRTAAARTMAEQQTVTPDKETAEWLRGLGLVAIDRIPVTRLIQKQQFALEAFLGSCRETGRLPGLVAAFDALGDEERDGLVNELKYAGYIARQQREAALIMENDSVRIPPDIDFHLPGLSRETVEKLSSIRPVSLGQASRIRGLTPAAISILRLHLRQRERMARRAHGPAAAARTVQGTPSRLERQDQPDRA